MIGGMVGMDKDEIKFVVIVSILALSLSALPFLYGYLVTPPGKEFTWITSHPNRVDINIYLSWIRQVANGGILIEEMYTPEPVPKLYFNPLFLFMGWMAFLSGLGAPITFHLSRLLFGFLLFLVIYKFVSYFVLNRTQRKIAFLLIAFSSGLGFTYPRIASTDIWMPESITFWSIYENPMFIISILLLLSAFLCFFKSLGSRGFRYPILSGLFVLLLGFIHPYELVTFFAVVSFYILYQFRRGAIKLKVITKTIGIILLFLVPSIIYNYHLFFSNSALSYWGTQNVLRSPLPQLYILGFGFVFLFATLGAYNAFKERDRRYTFPILWILLTFLLVYSPLNFQRRLIMGIHIPLCIMASVFLYKILFLGSKRAYNPKILLAVIITISSLTNVYILSMDISAFSRGVFPCYLEKDSVDAFAWLNWNSSPSSVVLSSYEIGNFIPAYSRNKVYIGHWAQTKEFNEKGRLTLSFFNSSVSEDWRNRFLMENHINYVFYGPFERGIGNASLFSANLREVYKNPSVTIYEVLNGKAA